MGRGGSQGHDRYHEQSFDEIDAITDVVDRRFPVEKADDRCQQGQGPQSEDYFHFAQKVKQLGPVVNRKWAF